MAEHYRFFDSVDGEDERLYTADEFAEYFRQVLSSGIFNGGDNLRVTTEGADMSLMIKPGYAWIEGYLYKIDTEPLVLTLDAADPALDRIDRIVIRLDKRLEHRYVKAFILKGGTTEDPTAPELTRDENIYEISLAQIKTIAGKSFIGEGEITDERYDENVCGIVNSLIKVDTSQLINKWEQWMDGIRGETFVPRDNLRDGFIKTKQDIIHAIPDRKIEISKGWPVDPDYIELNNSRIDENGEVVIDTFQVGGNLYKSDVLDTESTIKQVSINSSQRVAIPFLVNRETSRLKLTMNMEINSIARLQADIFESDEMGLPDTSRLVGRLVETSYSSWIPTILGRASKEVPLQENLLPEKHYALVLFNSYASGTNYSISFGYKNTPGQANFHYSSNGGASYTTYERTCFMEIDSLVDEGSVTLSQFALADFKNHLALGIDILDADKSFYEIDILDMDNNPIKQGVNVGDLLLDIDSQLYKNIKIRFRLVRGGLEEPRLANYQYTWVSDISHCQVMQSMMPSDNLILHYPGQRNVTVRNNADPGINVLKVLVPDGGQYRLTCELYSGYIQGGVVLLAMLYQGIGLTPLKIGRAQVNQGEQYVPVTVDLQAVPPNSIIYLNLGSGVTVDISLRMRNVKIYGTLGRQEAGIIVP